MFDSPELDNRGLSLVPIEIQDPQKEYGLDTDLSEMLTPESFQKVIDLFDGKATNVLTLIDLQNDFLAGGSLQVTDEETQNKIWDNLENLIKTNDFDAIILTKDHHLENDKSFKEKELKSDHTRTLGVLNGLLEDLWPSHCVQGTYGNRFHEKLIALLVKQCKHLPIITLTKEAYSAGLTTKPGVLASPYLPLLKALNVKINVVCGVATGYCASLTAEDAQKYGCETIFWLPGTAAITPAQEAAAIERMKNCGVKVITVCERHPLLLPKS